MLIFSVSFQFYRMIQKNIKVQFNSQESINIAEKSKKKCWARKKKPQKDYQKENKKKKHILLVKKVY